MAFFALTVLERSVMLLVLVAGGFLCAKVGIGDERMTKKMSDLLLLVITPALLLTSFMGGYDPETARKLLRALEYSAASFAVLFAVTYLFIPRVRNGRSIVERLSLIYSNCGFFGIPLVYGLFGDEGVMYMSVYIAMFNLLFWTHGISSMPSGNAPRKPFFRNLLSPAILSIAAGLVIYFARIRVPELIQEPFRYVADCNTPAAMLIAGATLSRSNFASCLKNGRIYAVSSVRLLLMPALVALVLRLLGAEHILAMVALIASACPSAVSVTALSSSTGNDTEYASQLFSFTTLISALTIPVISLFAGAIGL